MRYWRYVILVFCVLMIASCASRRKTATDSGGNIAIIDGAKVDMEKVVEVVNSNRQTEPFVTSKINMTLKTGSKDLSVGGSLKMKKDDVIQLSLVVLGMIEAGRMELTKDYFMIVDRIGHQYVKASYDEIDFFKKNNIDFFTFQSLFWNELFLLGYQGVTPNPTQFTKSIDASNIKLVNNDSHQVILKFLVNALTGQIVQTEFAAKTTGDNVIDWQYHDYSKFSNRKFPAKMQVIIHAGSSPISATFSLSNLKSDGGWETRTELSKKYEKVALDIVLRRLMNMSL